GDGFVLAYAINSKESLAEATGIRDKIIRILDVDPEKQTIPLVLVGNKCDLERERSISKAEGEEKSKEWKCLWFEASAKEKLMWIKSHCDNKKKTLVVGLYVALQKIKY
ncbi:hypothetical protein RFI_13859, partial [Reticulomyxa filosa]